MKFRLFRDKMVSGQGERSVTFLEAGTYEVVRLFDGRRIMVTTNYDRPRQVTIVKISDGELIP